MLIPAGIRGQCLFDFEIDSAAAGSCCLFSDWKQVPANRWCCDTLNPVEGAFSLRHCYDNAGEGCDFLVFRHDPLSFRDPFTVAFRIRHSCAPSAQNNWQVAIGAELFGVTAVTGETMAGDTGDGEVPRILNGIVVGVNYRGSDDLVKIWGVEEGEVTELCSTMLNFQEQVGTELAPLFVLEGDGLGGLSLSWSADPDTQLPVLLGSCSPGSVPPGRELILRYRYTASRDMSLWLDRVMILGYFEKDTVAPAVTEVEVTGRQSLQIDFSERIAEPGTGDFILLSDGQPGGVPPESLLGEGNGYRLFFADEITNRMPYRLRVKDIEDPDGNLLKDTVLNLMRNEARWGDLVFSEVMADPDPVVDYGEEYLELYNRSGYPLNPGGWLLRVNERSYLLDTSWQQPGEYMLIKGITLPNEGATLSLFSSEGSLVHALSYRVPWDGPEWKKEGGWSLESPDHDQLCMVPGDWEFSSDPGGGTPGRINSNRSKVVDKDPPVLLYAGIGDPGEFLLHYSEPVRCPGDSGPAVSIYPGGGVPDSVRFLAPLSDGLQLFFKEDFTSWTGYRLTLSGLTDCRGNPAGMQEYMAGKVSPPAKGSILINEIMFDPREGYPAYVELCLSGEKCYDLQDLAIHLVQEGGSPDAPLALAPCSRLFLPGQYLVLTECVPRLMDTYRLEVSGNWVEVKGLSGLKRSSGTIFLTDRAGNVVDMVDYNRDMHMELLDDPRGISLERISTERSGMDRDNWHSAASIEGYATPGRKNSQAVADVDPGALVEVQPQVFSPDNDGYNDLLKININTGGQDWVVGLIITDLQGNRVRELANNDLAGPRATYTWDGEGAHGASLPMGFYVVHVRGYHPATGEQWVRRRAVGLVYR